MYVLTSTNDNPFSPRFLLLKCEFMGLGQVTYIDPTSAGLRKVPAVHCVGLRAIYDVIVKDPRGQVK